MRCPKCQNVDLKATKLEEGLPVMGCPKCEGALVSLLIYRDWSERTPLEPTDETPLEAVEEQDTKTAATCPKCSKLMTKYRVSEGHKNKIDLCSACDEAWLDGGEWELIKSLQLVKDVPKVFTETWQKKIRQSITEKQKVERLARIVSDEDVKKAQEAKLWLKDHEHKFALLQFIGAD